MGSDYLTLVEWNAGSLGIRTTSTHTPEELDDIISEVMEG